MGEIYIDNKWLVLTVDEVRKMLGIGKNLMLKLVKVKDFPAVRFKRKIIINKELLPKWFEENCGEYGATGGIRIPDLSVRSRVLYPAKLQSHIIKILL